MGTPVTITETIDQDTAELLIEEFGHRINRVSGIRRRYPDRRGRRCTGNAASASRRW
jgi:hypothetical protein